MALLLRVTMALLMMTCGAVAAEHRSRAVTYEFQKANPCPSTGLATGACPGCVKDHINPLCNGGPDSVENMQWQTVADAKAKDRWERKICSSRAIAP